MIFIILFLVLLTFACLGIFLSKQSVLVELYTSKSHTILFATILSIIIFFWDYGQNVSVMHSLGYVIGFIFLFTVPASFMAVYLFNKSFSNSKEFFHALFFSLIIVLISFLDYV
jgi:hypothetical protein